MAFIHKAVLAGTLLLVPHTTSNHPQQALLQVQPPGGNSHPQQAQLQAQLSAVSYSMAYFMQAFPLADKISASPPSSGVNATTENCRYEDYSTSLERAAFCLGQIEKGNSSYHNMFRQEIRIAATESPVSAAYFMEKYALLLGDKDPAKEKYLKWAEAIFQKQVEIENKGKQSAGSKPPGNTGIGPVGP